MPTRRERSLEQVTLLRQALDRATSCREKGQFASATRIAYDVIEKTLKAALLYVDVEPPPWVDVGPQLDENRVKFPEGFRENVDLMVYAARVAWEEREAGFEAQDMSDPADHLYDDYDAESALDTANRVLEMVEALAQTSRRE